jgi:NAD(P)H-hydrate repair Nnr-like enzyme with NAD(P)H-hydrate epimerase domain
MSQGILNTKMKSLVDGIFSIRGYGVQPQMRKKFYSALDHYSDNQFTVFALDSWSGMLIDMVGNSYFVINVLLYIFGL